MSFLTLFVHTCLPIVHPESFRSNAQNANAFARRNCPRIKRNGAFICVRVRLRSFASTVRDRPRALMCVRTRLRTYIYIYTVRSRACSGSSGTTAAGRFQLNRIFCSRTISVLPARLRHQPGCTRLACRPTGRDQLDPPLRESSRQINELHVVRPVRLRELCARIWIYDRACVRARIYMYMRMLLYPREFAFVYMHKHKRSFLRAFACVSSRGVN